MKLLSDRREEKKHYKKNVCDIICHCCTKMMDIVAACACSVIVFNVHTHLYYCVRVLKCKIFYDYITRQQQQKCMFLLVLKLT